MYSNKVKKHVPIYNSDDEKIEKKSIDSRLKFINRADQAQFKNEESKSNEI